MTKTLQITLLQTRIEWLDSDTNIASASRLMASSAGSDLYVLPEMWSTGFIVDEMSVSKHCSGNSSQRTLAWMREMSTSYGAAVCGSLPVMEHGELFNRLYFVTPEGGEWHYDKRHLFTMGNEDQQYTPGSERVIVNYRGVRFLLAVCYDLRFPVWLRNQDDYDVLLIVANWPQSRQHVWDVLLRARAIENQCFVAACNRVGEDPVCTYAGGSLFVDARGITLNKPVLGKEGAITATLDFESLASFRKKFPLLSDRDIFQLNTPS